MLLGHFAVAKFISIKKKEVAYAADAKVYTIKLSIVT